MSKEIGKRPLQIITNYGPKHQQEILKGEYEELQDAIDEVELRHEKELNYYYKDILVDEVADVLVMLLEYIQYYDLPKEMIEDRVDYKLDRQLGRMENENKRREQSV